VRGTLLPGGAGSLARRRRTPESIRYRPAPLRVVVDASELTLPGGVTSVAPTRAELSLFDFGALSLMVHFPVRLTPAELRDLAGAFAEPAPLTAAARRLVGNPPSNACNRRSLSPRFSDISEEYVIFQMPDAHPDWLQEHNEWVAGLVRLESDPAQPE